MLSFFTDGDGDGYGTAPSIDACSAPAGFSAVGGDCDDSNALVSPVGVEVCDLVDNNCNDVIDEGCGHSTGGTYISCNGLGTGITQCYWRYEFDPAQCNPTCDKLVLFFGGGGMNCDTEGYDLEEVTRDYANNGYIATCIDTFKDSGPAGNFPFNLEAGRVDRLISTITSDPIIQQKWSGKDLLISGVSHGATSPAIAMARTSFDDNAYWHGSETTGACFYDGIYDVDAQLDFIITNVCDGAALSLLDYPRYVGRYCQPLPTFPAVCDNFYTDSALDDMPTVDYRNPDTFSIKNWKMMACGSNAPTGNDACYLELVPKISTEGMCGNLNSGGGTSCEFLDLPFSEGYTHFNCAIDRIDLCREWFDGLASSGTPSSFAVLSSTDDSRSLVTFFSGIKNFLAAIF